MQIGDLPSLGEGSADAEQGEVSSIGKGSEDSHATQLQGKTDDLIASAENPNTVIEQNQSPKQPA